jgi:UDP-N-acetylglucosamine 2-epimerase (non-hydrolysing)
MKIAPVYHALKNEVWCDVKIIHTGQHYDTNMSDAFFRDLGLPAPDFYLDVGSGTHAEQMAGVMMAYERVCFREQPDWIIVVGDVNSTAACALVGAKLCIAVAHLEAGLRSRDRTMPEEINRIVTDSVSSLLWTPSADADENLKNEGIPTEKIERVGNIMIDSYELLRTKIERDDTRRKLSLQAGQYGVVTLHRPSNVDNQHTLLLLISQLRKAASALPLVFSVHPRTRKQLEKFQLRKALQDTPGLKMIEPLGYIQFMNLVRDAKLVITDSGGIQEETTYLNIACLTLRDTTERPITISQGTNRLVKPHDLLSAVETVLASGLQHTRCPELWDGHTAARVVESLRKRMLKTVIR